MHLGLSSDHLFQPPPSPWSWPPLPWLPLNTTGLASGHGIHGGGGSDHTGQNGGNGSSTAGSSGGGGIIYCT